MVYWSDIDWGRHTLRVQRALVKSAIKDTKTSRVREVDLNARALAVLNRQKRHSLALGLNTPVFLNPVTDRPWPDEKQQRERYFLPTLADLGLRRRGAYQTRHTFATIALMGGVNPAYIARQLGHTTTDMLFKHYAKWIDGADKGREAARLNLLMGGGAPGATAIGYRTLAASAFDDDAGAARRAAVKEPIFITEQGRPVQVLLSMASYEKLMAGGREVDGEAA